MDALFAGRLDAAASRQMLVRPGSGFVLEDCRAQPGFFKAIAGFTKVVWRDGCVVVFELQGIHQPPSDDQPPLPQIPSTVGLK